MAAAFGRIIILLCAFLFRGAASAVMYAAHNTTVKLTCTDTNNEQYNPVWYVFGPLDEYIRIIRSRNDDTGELMGTVIFNGNHTCGTFQAFCRLFNGQNMHNTTLIVGGRLPSPENVQINGSLVIKWDPPYTAINNNETSVIHVDPHITQYTVYIIDNYTGNYMDEVNITEETFSRNTPDVNSCPTYGVTAWNSGGEGRMSPPLPGVPKHIAAKDVDIHTVSGVLDIDIHVTDPCTVRRPNSFLVTVMSTVWDVTTTVHVQNPVATIHVVLPQTADECNLIVAISAGNSAGMSSPTNITVGCPTTDDSTDPATTTTTANTGRDTNSTDLVDQNQQGDSSIIYIAVGSAIGGAVLVVAVPLIILWKCKRNTSKVEPPAENIYTKSPSLGGPPVYQPDSHPVGGDTSTESHWTLGTESSRSDKPPPKPTGPQAPKGNPQLVYARIDPAKHGRLQPPASDNQVQYAQLQYQDQL